MLLVSLSPSCKVHTSDSKFSLCATACFHGHGTTCCCLSCLLVDPDTVRQVHYEFMMPTPAEPVQANLYDAYDERELVLAVAVSDIEALHRKARPCHV